jgi:glyceraldehyde-3-phosphate dehydrogenase/erythrose-4-phosphate dehydrogenase
MRELHDELHHTSDVAKPTTVDEVKRVFTEESGSERYRGIVGVTRDPVVSSDIIRDSRASVVDLGMTQVVDGDLVKVMSWYDNEWGYSSQLVREASRIAREIDSSRVIPDAIVVHDVAARNVNQQKL